MIKVIDIVSDLLKSDELASESMKAGLLNLSAYAEKILPQVEKISYREIKKGTIVVALSRLAQAINPKTAPFKPELKLTNLGIKSSLAAIVFDKTADIQRKVSVLHPFQITAEDLFSLTEGPTEVTLVCTEKSKDKIIKLFDSPVKFQFDDLVAITVQYTEELAKLPNIYYSLVSALATKRINIIEMLTTYTEVTFIVKKIDMEPAIQALNVYFAKTSPTK